MDVLALIPQFGSLAFTVTAFVVALSIIVFVHEYGHYIVGRWSGIHAEVFSVGFGPVLWSRIDRRGTRWQIAALPFGGYVKFLGDADAASGKDGAAMAAMPDRDRRRTMHGAPLWARAATVAAGPIFNFILAIAVFAGFFVVNGVATEDPVVGELKPMPFAAASLEPGDRITALNGTATPDLSAFIEAARALPGGTAAEYTVQRGTDTLTFPGPHPFPPVADVVQPQSAAGDVGMRAGDVILSVDGTPVASFEQLRSIAGASGGKPLLLQVWRAGETMDIALVPRKRDLPLPEGGFETRWLIGLSGGLVFVPEARTPGPFEAIGLAGQETWRIITTSLSGLAHMVTGAISACNLQGPIGIAETSGDAAAQGFGTFVLFLAMLSTGVGLLNLFPVPVLDGGHLVFHAWEAITGKPPGDRALRVMMAMGLAALLSLMVFALGNDLFCA
jgi:regulator of sigma E protease